MITASITTRHGSQTIRVNGLVNRGRWFGETWLIEIGIGFGSLFFVVESDNETDAIDEFTDSRFGHLIKIDDPSDLESDDRQSYAGNAGDPVNLDNVAIYKCKVNYFAKQDR